MITFTQLAIAIALLLVTASFVLNSQKKRKSHVEGKVAEVNEAEHQKNHQRLFVWWQIYAVCIAVFAFSGLFLHFFVAVLLYWVFLELQEMFQKNISPFLLIFICSMVFVLCYLWAYIDIDSLIFYIFLLTLISAWACYKASTHSTFYPVILGAYVTCGLLSIVALANIMFQWGFDDSYVLLLLFFVTALNDIAQYISGKLFGGKLFERSQIAPSISPNKTFEGLFGGIVLTSIVCTFLLKDLLSISMIQAYFIGSLLAVSGFLGDLIMSKIKRGLDLKDSGTSLGAHGGLLDRLDSLLLITPVFGICLLIAVPGWSVFWF